MYKKNKNKYFNIKINIKKPRLLTEIHKNYKKANSSLNKERKDNKFKKSKSNSVTKLKIRNKIKMNDNKNNKNKKLTKSKDNNIDSIPKIEIMSNKKKINSIKTKINNNLKNNNYNTINAIKKIKISKLKSRNNEEINSQFNTIKSIENQLTERNKRINNIRRNNKFDLLDNNLNIKKIKNFSSKLQKLIPSLKGITIKEKKPLIKKSLMNLMGNLNSVKNNINNKDIILRMNKNKIINQLKIDNNKDINRNNKTLNKINIKSNNIIDTKIRKISPIKNNKFVKSTIYNSSNLIDNNKEISKINNIIKNNIKIKPLKIKEIKSINLYNNCDVKPKTSRRYNLENKDKNINFYEDFFNFKKENQDKIKNISINLKKKNK